MLAIAGGVLLAIAVLAVLVATFRYIVLALSALFCLAITAGIWFLLASGIGPWWATVMLIAGFAIWFWSANREPTIGKLPAAGVGEHGQDFGQKIS
jgi:hypothetical protein